MCKPFLFGKRRFHFSSLNCSSLHSSSADDCAMRDYETSFRRCCGLPSRFGFWLHGPFKSLVPYFVFRCAPAGDARNGSGRRCLSNPDVRSGYRAAPSFFANKVRRLVPVSRVAGWVYNLPAIYVVDLPAFALQLRRCCG